MLPGLTAWSKAQVPHDKEAGGLTNLKGMH